MQAGGKPAPRRIVQMTAAGYELYALDDRGDLWCLGFDGRWGVWVQMPELPE